MNLKDLADLAWIRVETATLGELTISACSGDFVDWTRSGLRAKRWPDGPSLVRDLLATHARPGREAEPIGADAANGMTPTDLDQVADAFLTATGVYFRPRTVAEGQGARRTIRRRRDNEGDDLAAREGEGGAERLKRVLEAWIQDRADASAVIVQQAGLATTQLIESAAEAAGITQMLEDQRRLAAIMDPMPGITAAMKTIETPVYTSLIESMKPSPALAASLEAMKPLPAMEAIREMFTPTNGIIAQIKAQQVRMAEIAKMVTVPQTHVLAGLKLYPNMGIDLASRFGIGDGIARSTKAMADALAIPARVEMPWLKALADQGAMAAAISRQFDMRVPAATLAAMSVLTASSAIADAVRAHSFFPPGFQMAAAMGLDNAVARGLVSDVLHSYDAPAPHAPVFAEALESIAIVDAGVFTDAEAISYLQRVAGWLMSAIQAEPDIIRRNGLLSFLIFVMAVIGCYTGIDGLIVSKHSLAVAEETLTVAKADPTHNDVEALINATRAVGEAVKAGQQSEAAAHDRIRYVVDRTPLRVEPQAYGLLLRQLYPDQVLRVIGERDDWVEVEAFDYSTDAPMRGWVSRRRLRLKPQS
jgi:hypothetical protein